MRYGRRCIIQFKTEEYLTEKLNWNKEYAKIVCDQIGIITDVDYFRYEIELYKDRSVKVVANEDSVFIPSGYIRNKE